MKVMKFGGSTIKDAKMIHMVADNILQEKKVVVVVSALYRQTNEIREFISKNHTEKKKVEAFVKKIRKRHMTFAEDAVSDKKILSNVQKELERLILKLERLLFGVAYVEELTPRTSDLILSTAERMSAYIMEGVLRSRGVKAKAYESDQVGVITDGFFGNATAILDRTEKNLKKKLKKELKKGTVPVITGFFGSDEEGHTTTFGRNGSDYSAAVIAYALNADTLELWKDVDGFMSADPNIIKNAKAIKRLSYAEAAELAYFGMTLLHPRTVEPVSMKNIPIVIKNILRPKGKGTLIAKKGYRSGRVIKSVVSTTDLAEIKVSGAGVGYRPGVLKEISGTLSDSNINIYTVIASQTQISFMIHKEDADRCSRLFERMHRGVVESIDLKKDIALVCVVGEGLYDTKGLAGEIFTVVGKTGTNIEIISAGVSDVAFHFIVKQRALKKTIKAIHNSFC
jgi:aspartate kinase